MLFRVIVLLLTAFGANSEYLTKKFCDGVPSTMCAVHSVSLDPCAEGPSFCALRRNKHYSITVDLTPRFSAEKVNVGVWADELNKGNFSTALKTPVEGCEILSCPVEAGVRRLFDVDFIFGKKFNVNEKFPLKVMLWDEEKSLRESHICCFTFNVKVVK